MNRQRTKRGETGVGGKKKRGCLPFNSVRDAGWTRGYPRKEKKGSTGGAMRKKGGAQVLGSQKAMAWKKKGVHVDVGKEGCRVHALRPPGDLED